MVPGKTAAALALMSTLAAGSQGAQSCDTSTSRAPAKQQVDSSQVEYSATCDNHGGVASYRPHTSAAKQAATRACRNVDNYARTLQGAVS
jgi:hypothetical protein